MLISAIRQILKGTPNPVVIECGACNGRDTVAMLMSAQGTPKIISFEPDPRNAWECKRTIPPVVIFEEAAVGNVTGQVPFHLAAPQPNGEIGSSSLSAFKDLTKAFPWCTEMGTISVESYRLDDYCKMFKIPYIDLLWADVQGAELMLIEGAQHMLTRTRYFYTEFEGIQAHEAGTLYETSASLEHIRRALPHPEHWRVLVVWEGNALLINDIVADNPNTPADLIHGVV